MLSFCTYFVLWFFNLAFVSGGLLFKSKQQNTTKYFTLTVTTKFAQRHNRNNFCNSLWQTQFLKFKQKNIAVLIFSVAVFGGHIFAFCFIFGLDTFFKFVTTKLKIVLFFGSSFRWTHFCVLFYFPVGHIF